MITTYTVEYIDDGADTPTRFTYNADQRVSAVQRARRLSLARRDVVYVVKTVEKAIGLCVNVGHLVYYNGYLSDKAGDTK